MEKGLILINTGDGKGKTTAALGTAIRAWGEGLKVLIFQFIKGNLSYGELKAVRTLQGYDGNIEIRQLGDGFVFYKSKSTPASVEKKKELAQKGWNEVVREVKSGRWDLIVLDEINYAIHFGLIQEDQVIQMLKEKPVHLNLILTGRYAPKGLIDMADTVTEMKLVKHAFQKGIRARKGIEF